MNNINIITKRPADLSLSDYNELAEITRAAFQERLHDNLRMLPNHLTGEALQAHRSENDYIILALNENKLAGYTILHIESDPNGALRGEEKIIAIHPDNKKQGLGQKLFETLEKLAIDAGCVYLQTDTSLKALSAVKYHLSCGFEKWAYTHFATANYYSVYFRKYLDRKQRPRHTKIHLLTSWIRAKCKWRESGQMGAMHRIKMHMHGDSELTYVDGTKLTLGQIQQVSYDLLNTFISFCEKHQLKYMLCYGSLLGAVRHNGFIPWDDDIDVAMPLPDYKRFIDLFEGNNLSKNYEILYGVKRGIAINHAMLCDKRTQSRVKSRDKEHSRPIAIDIFPTFPIADDDITAQSQINELVDTVLRVEKCQNIRISNAGLLPYWYRLFFNGAILERELRKLSDILHRYKWGSTQRVRILSLYERDLLSFPANCFDSSIDWKFEDLICKIPAQYHENLSENYGESYMDLPEESERKAFLDGAFWMSDTPPPISRIDQETQISGENKDFDSLRDGEYATRIKLFTFLPLISVQSTKSRLRVSLLGLPLIVLKKKETKRRLILFGFLPLASWKYRYIN